MRVGFGRSGGIDRAAFAAQLGAQLQNLVHQIFLFLPAGVQLRQPRFLGLQFFGGGSLTLGGVDTDRRFAGDDLQFGFQPLDAAAAVLDLRRHRVQADRHPGAGGIQQADRLVRQLAGRNVAVRQLDRRFQRFVENLRPMMLFHGRSHAAHHQDGLLLAGFADLHHLKTAGQGRILFDMLLVLGPGGGGDGAQLAAGERGFQQIGGVAGARRAAGADQGMRLVDEQDDRLGRGLDLVDHLPQPVLELALHAGAGLQQPHVQHPQGHVPERRRHVPGRDALGEAFHHRRLADAGLAGQDRVVLTTAHQNIDDLADFLVATHDGIQFTLARPRGQIHGKPLQGFLLAQLRRRHGFAGFAGRRAAADLGAIRGAQPGFRGSGDDVGESFGQRIQLDLVELAGDGQQRVAQIRRLQHPHQQMADAHLRIIEQQGRVDPRLFHRRIHVRGQVGNRGRAARQPIQRLGEILGDAARIQAKMLDDPVQIRILKLQDLMQPVHELHIGIAPQLAEDGGALDSFVADAVQFPEQGNTTDFGHGFGLRALNAVVRCNRSRHPA